MEKNIPKIIYSTHETKQDCQKYQKVFDITKEKMKNYETIFYYKKDIEKFILEKYGKRIFNAYNSINPQYGPARADLFRYLLIYYYGGMYLDMKSGPVKNMDKLIESLKGKLAISNWLNFPAGLIPIDLIDEMYWSSIIDSNYGEYQNWHIVSGKGNPILKLVIQQTVSNIEQGIKNNKYHQGKTSVVGMTGPLMLTKVIDKYYDPKYVKKFKPNLDYHLKYKIVDHIAIEKNKHYKKVKNKSILL